MKKKIAVLLLPALLLSGCSGLLESKAPLQQTYVITPADATIAGAPQLDVDLAVSQPSSAPGLNTDRILLLREGRRLDYYAKAQWGAQAPRVMQYFVIAALQAQNLFRSVTSDDVRTTAPYVLDVELRDFQAEYSAAGVPPTVRVTIVASLMRVHDRSLIAVVPVTETATASQDRMGPIVAAFESAARQASTTLGSQLIGLIHNAPADKSPSLDQ
jgi:cholesterol transport system auxiliary component